MQILFEMIHLAWLAGLTFAVVKLWDKLEPIQDQHTESIDSAWEPVDLNDQREFEMDEKEKRMQMFKV